MSDKIRIGTRGSKLALWQAYFVEERIKEAGGDCEIITIETKGDKILNTSISKIGSKGVFTEELEDQLKDGSIDIAVHSAKDIQASLADGFSLIAFSEREKTNDVVISFNKDFKLSDSSQLTVGTSSTRRVAMLSRMYPTIRLTDMRGNLQTRLKKLKEGPCDAIILAYAGVHRMGYEEYIAEELSTDIFTPAVGQGCVAIEAHENLPAHKKELVRNAINDTATERLLLLERAFLKKLNGGCSVPIFGLASYTPSGNEIIFNAGIVSLDGKEIVRESFTYSLGTSPEKAGTEAAEQILSSGGKSILEEILSQK